MGYVGNQQTEGYSQVPAKQDLTGATGTSLTLTHAVASAEGIDLFINNVRQEPTTAYSVGADGVTVTLTGSVVATDDIYVVYNSLARQTSTHPSNQALQATSAAFSGAVTVGPADSGGTANSNADDLVIDNSANGGITILTANTGSGSLRFGDPDAASQGEVTYDHSDDSMRFFTNNTEECRITSGGRLQLGTAIGDTYGGGVLHVGGYSYFTNNFAVVPNVGDDVSYTNASSPTGVEATEAGFLAYIADSATGGRFGRIGTDGSIVLFYAQGNSEGSISISGTTTSFNGGHLSRWSQLTDNTRDTSIVKGTVLTNLDQMADWTNDGVTEDNEQLNCMAVSSVEGDPNVAGVFVNWDDDDDIYHNDMNVAMTGDMVIRIAQGTTVQRGDLLMSAGDGTAKPQGDDIVRSKTIAKVTSTHVSHTYDDGSYLVPCVLMAC